MPVSSSTGTYGSLTPVPTTPASKPWTTDSWAALVLSDAGLPVTANNIANLTKVIRAESLGNLFPSGATGNWLRDNNPFNVAGFYGGTATQQFGTTVYTYSTPENGANATAQEINSPVMSNIRAALAADAPPAVFGHAWQSSAWASGGYGGANIGTDFAAYFADAAGNATAQLSNPLHRAANATTVSILGDALNNAAGLGGITNLGGISNATGGALSGLGAIGNVFGKLGDATFWRRIGIFAGGAAIFGIGLAVFFASTDTGKKTIAAAAKAAI